MVGVTGHTYRPVTGLESLGFSRGKDHTPARLGVHILRSYKVVGGRVAVAGLHAYPVCHVEGPDLLRSG